MTEGAHDVTLSTDPFVDAPNGDFRVNTAPGGGAALRGAAYPATFRGASATTPALDGGAAQSEPPTLPTEAQVQEGVAYGYYDELTGQLAGGGGTVIVLED